jgi:predicted SpoU family rRNA methylase
MLYAEVEDGMLPATREGGRSFDPRLIDYRIDVQRLMDRELSVADQDVLMAIHRDGLTHADALAAAHITTTLQPYSYVAALETRMGRLFERKKMLDLVGYLR